MTTDYCALADLKDELSIVSTEHDGKLALCITAASRQIEAFCGRRFYADTQTSDRTYFGDDAWNCEIDDLSTLTGLVVKIDTNFDGSYAQTLTIDTDFIAMPLNAPSQIPAEPYRHIRLIQAYTPFTIPMGPRPGLKVTATWGWPAIPDEVKKACRLQAALLFKAKDTAFGVAEFAGAGVAMRVQRMHPVAAALLDPFMKAAVG